MTFYYWFSLFSVAQGAFILGFSFYIIFYFLPKKKHDYGDFYVILISISYFLLNAATIESAMLGLYLAHDIWYSFVIIAYIAGDLALYKIFRRAAFKKILEKSKDKIIKEQLRKIHQLEKLLNENT